MLANAATMRILIKGGKVVNDDCTLEADVYIENGIIQQVGRELMIPGGAKVIDATGKLVIPGGIDTSTHFHQTFMNATCVDDFYHGTKVPPPRSAAGAAGGSAWSTRSRGGCRAGESVRWPDPASGRCVAWARSLPRHCGQPAASAPPAAWDGTACPPRPVPCTGCRSLGVSRGQRGLVPSSAGAGCLRRPAQSSHCAVPALAVPGPGVPGIAAAAAAKGSGGRSHATAQRGARRCARGQGVGAASTSTPCRACSPCRQAAPQHRAGTTGLLLARGGQLVKELWGLAGLGEPGTPPV